jgi:DNA recombination protein RmuC
MMLNLVIPLLLLLLLIGVVVLLLRPSLGDPAALERAIRADLQAAREEQGRVARELREELRAMGKDSTAQVAAQLKELREGNEKKLDEMRHTVDEKLQGTLETRLGESFKLVSDRLEQVHKGLGEMQGLATGVGDLKRALTNVKSRGVFGEVQLAALLEQVLTPEQYVRNYKPQSGSGEMVEFAVKFPGAFLDGEPVYLPVDAKFPQEDYQRILAAYEAGDAEGVRTAQAQLLAVVKKCAADIRDKYLHPPATTDFGVLFLPTEGLYAEVLRSAGTVEELQRTFRVHLAGPTTLQALLMSFRVGFRTLVIEKRSSEIWQMLGAVRNEFDKYGTVLDKLRKQLSAASNTVEETAKRTRAMGRKLRDVETLPDAEAQRLLAIPAESNSGEDEEE